MRTPAHIQQTDSFPASSPAAVTEDAIRSYLAELSSRGRARDTVCMYSARLKTLWDYLAPDKLIYPGTLAAWRAVLLEHGYSAATVNTHITAANGLLDYMGRQDLRLQGHLEVTRDIQPELTRREYLRLLQTAKALNRERTYLLIKTLALTGIQATDLPRVTVGTVKAGRFFVTSEGKRRMIFLPGCLSRELADYAARRGILSGPVFLTRNGKTLQRTQVTSEIQALSRDARVDGAKCNPRCLRKLCRAAQAEIERTVRALAIQSYEQMLETEQLTVGWDEG